MYFGIMFWIGFVATPILAPARCKGLLRGGVSAPKTIPESRRPLPKNTAQIGKREERQIVKDLEALGYKARRQPGSGNRAVDLQHDVLWQDSPAGKLHIEDKYRRDSQWKTLESYRAGADILTVRCDGRVAGQDGERMAFLPWKLLLELVGEAPATEYQRVFAENGDAMLVPKRKIQSRNDWPKGRKLQSRGFGK